MMINEAALSIDIGGTKVLCGIVTRDGRIIDTEKCPFDCKTCDALTALIESACDALIGRLSGTIRLTVIGIGVKGFVDVMQNRLTASSLFGGPVDYDLCSLLSARYHLPAFIDNDVNAAASAEMLLGFGREHAFFTYVNVGTGIAIGIVENGKLIRGHANLSGEVGYLLCRLEGDKNLVRLEDVAGGKGMSDEAHRLLCRHPESLLAGELAECDRIPFGSICAASQKGDALAELVIGRAVSALAAAIINFECVAGSGCYVFGGGVFSEPYFFDRVEKEILRLSQEHALSFTYDLHLSELGAGNVSLLGAACVGFSGL